jgi:hypothetical protein
LEENGMWKDETWATLMQTTYQEYITGCATQVQTAIQDCITAQNALVIASNETKFETSVGKLLHALALVEIYPSLTKSTLENMEFKILVKMEALRTIRVAQQWFQDKNISLDRLHERCNDLVQPPFGTLPVPPEIQKSLAFCTDEPLLDRELTKDLELFAQFQSPFLELFDNVTTTIDASMLANVKSITQAFYHDNDLTKIKNAYTAASVAQRLVPVIAAWRELKLQAVGVVELAYIDVFLKKFQDSFLGLQNFAGNICTTNDEFQNHCLETLKLQCPNCDYIQDLKPFEYRNKNNAVVDQLANLRAVLKEENEYVNYDHEFD